MLVKYFDFPFIKIKFCFWSIIRMNIIFNNYIQVKYKHDTKKTSKLQFYYQIMNIGCDDWLVSRIRYLLYFCIKVYKTLLLFSGLLSCSTFLLLLLYIRVSFITSLVFLFHKSYPETCSCCYEYNIQFKAILNYLSD